MKILGNDVYIQRGETWSLDFDVTNERNEPYMLLSKWDNPYLAITVTAARYAQKGDFRRTYWLDLTNRWVEQEDGTSVLKPMKKFTSTQALPVPSFNIDDVLSLYGTEAGGRLVLNKSSDFDVTNFLFYTDDKADNTRVFKYIEDYTVGNTYNVNPEIYSSDRGYSAGDVVQKGEKIYMACADIEQAYSPERGGDWIETDINPLMPMVDKPYIGKKHYKGYTGVTDNKAAVYVNDNTVFLSPQKTSLSATNTILSQTWTEYSFRVVKQFDTKEWVEQGYLFDMKILAGESLEEHVYAMHMEHNTQDLPELPWDMVTLLDQIQRITWDKPRQTEMLEIFLSGMPLMPTYDTKSLILQPTNLYVSANIQGGL